jgi:two-component system cell cycle response regulator DivK
MAQILVIEDNATNMKLMRFLLEQAGHEVVGHATAHEALAYLEHNRPALVLMDIQLPDMDGLTATRKIREKPELTGLPVIAVTAFAMKGDEARAREAGCDAYITKPIRYQSLLETVKAYVGA